MFLPDDHSFLAHFLTKTTSTFNYKNLHHILGRFHLSVLILIYLLSTEHLINSQEFNSLQHSSALNKKDNNDYSQTRSTKSNNVSTIQMQILALFSGTSQDLGIDHRLGRQVLELAASRAKQLHPELKGIELIVQSDDTPCTSLNQIPTKLVEYIYQGSSSENGSSLQEQCSMNTNYETNKECSSQNLDPENQPDLSDNSATNKRFKRFLDENKSWVKRVDAIIGPSCDFLVDLIARMAAYWRTPIYSVTSIDASFSRKDIYSTLTRLSPSVDHLSIFILKVMERFKWRHLAIIVDKDQIENAILSDNLERSIGKMQHLIPIERQLFPFNSLKELEAPLGNSTARSNIITPLFSRTVSSLSSLCTTQAREVLLRSRKVARVFLFLINDPQVIRKLLLCAHELHMNNGEFTFLAVNLNLKSATIVQQLDSKVGEDRAKEPIKGSSPSNSNEPERIASSTKLRSISGRTGAQTFDWYSDDHETNNILAKEMFESLLVFSVELPVGDEYNYFVEETLDMAQREYPEIQFERSSVGSIAVALHDSLLIAVEAHLRNLNNNKTHLSPKGLQQEDDNSDEQQTIDDDQREFELYKGKAALLWNEHYSNGLIKAMHINSNGDQETDYILSDLEPETGAMKPVISYSKKSRQLEFIPNSYIHWPRQRKSGLANEVLDSDKSPPDEPECGFNGDAERCIDRQNLYAALLVSSILLILIAISTSISIYKYSHIKYQMQLDDYWWKINWDNLKFVQATDSLASNAPSIARAFKSGDGASSILSIENDGSSVVSVSRPKSNSENLMEIKKHKELNHTTGQDHISGSIISGSVKSEFANKRNSQRRSAIPLIITPKASGEAKSIDSSASKIGSGIRAASLLSGPCLIRSEYSSVIRASNLALYKNEIVIVKQLNASKLELSRELLVELKSIRDLISDNLAKFVGLCLDPGRLSIVYEYCSRGSLKDMLANTDVSMDLTLKYSIIGDIVNGLSFIHTTSLNYHGRLKSTNLVLDSRFTVKITDFGLQNLYSQLEIIDHQEEDESEVSSNENDELTNAIPPMTGRPQEYDTLSIAQSGYNMESVSVRDQKISRKGAGQGTRVLLKNRGAARYFWTAPEHLREKNLHRAGSKKGDVYSLAIIFYEIITRKEPYLYGTSAKPNWLSIKQDRKTFIQQQQQQVVSTVGSVASKLKRRQSRTIGGSEVSVADQSTVVGSITRQAKRVQGQLKRINAAVDPKIEQIEPTDSLAETGSIVSATNHSLISQAEIDPSGIRPSANSQTVISQTSFNHLKQKPSKLSVTAIDEGEEDGAGQGSNNRKNDESMIDAEQILDQVRMGIKPEPIRPYIPNYVIQETDSKLIELMRTCWNEEPAMRPSLIQVRNSLRRITRGIASKNYLDNLLDRLQKYAENLEQIVDAKSSDIVSEKLRTEELLYQLVPKFVADRLKQNEPIIPQVFDGVTIFFSDIVGFEKYAAVMSPIELVDLLNNIYSSFDSIISSFDVTKIETIIDQFLVASGISWQQENKSMTRGYSIEQKQHQQSTSGLKRQISIERNKGYTTEEEGSFALTMKELSGSDGDKLNKRRKFSKTKKLGLLKSLRRSQASFESKAIDQQAELRKDSAKNTSLESSRTDSKDLQGNLLECVEEGVVSGIKTMDSTHYRRSSAEQIARMALCIRDLVKSFHFRQSLDNMSKSGNKNDDKANRESDSSCRNIVAASFNIRIGMHSGKVCAGIVGVKRPKFCLIGDTVNVASRMHTNSKANKIQISADTKDLLEQVSGFNIEARGMIEVKGKGMMETFWLDSSY